MLLVAIAFVAAAAVEAPVTAPVVASHKGEYVDDGHTMMPHIIAFVHVETAHVHGHTTPHSDARLLRVLPGQVESTLVNRDGGSLARQTTPLCCVTWEHEAVSNNGMLARRT